MNLDALMHGLKDIGYTGCFTFEATQMLLPAKLRRPFESDQRLMCAPLSVRIAAEKLLYEIGRTILDAYTTT